MKRIITALTLAVLIVLLLLPVGAVNAQDAVSVEVEPTARAIAGGQTLLVTVEIACEPGLEVLEAHVSAQQGATFGQAGIGAVVCNGRAHQYKVLISAPEGQFTSGEAYVSAFVLVLDPQTQMTQQGQDARTVTVVGAPR